MVLFERRMETRTSTHTHVQVRWEMPLTTITSRVDTPLDGSDKCFVSPLMLFISSLTRVVLWE